MTFKYGNLLILLFWFLAESGCRRSYFLADKRQFLSDKKLWILTAVIRYFFFLNINHLVNGCFQK